MVMQLFARGFRCLSTAPSQVKLYNVYVKFALFNCSSGPATQGGCGCTGGEAEEGKASAGGPQVRDDLHRPHAGDGVGRGWGMEGTKDCASGPTGYPSRGHCAPVRTGKNG